MKKKIMALLLCACFLIPLLVPAYATGDTTTDAGEGDESSFAEMTVADQYAYITDLFEKDEDAAHRLMDSLTEEQQAALLAYAETVAPTDPVTTPSTVDYTDAGPFFPAVDVSPASYLRKLKAARVENDGVFTDKTATPNDDGSYTIRMETYVTGQTITASHTQPVDFVLVIDQSGSMASTFSTGQTYQAAMQQSINTFIKNVNSKYDATYSDHRIALVTFAASSKTLVDWTFVNDAGASKLTTAINGLTASGVTDTAGGMTQAQQLMTTRYNYNGKNTKRQKVVVLFTDGIPYTGGNAYYSENGILTSQIDMTNANSAIRTARSLKNSNVTMYTIGIFNGANVNELYDAQGYVFANAFGGVNRKDACTGKLTEVWGFSGYLNVSRQNDFGYLETAVCNRLLNYISSNFASATELGVKYHHSEKPSTSKYANITGHPVARGFFFEITKNATRTKSGYYLTASNVNALNNIFSKISENISTPDVELGSKTVVKDIVTPYFDVPANTAAITLKVASYNRNGNWNAETTAPASVKASISGDTIEVTGFDFATNFVSETYRSGVGYGSKLIVEFKVTPKRSFLGGNDVPTNGDDSGVYAEDGSVVENYVRPTVNVTIKPVDFTVNDLTIYEGNSVSANDLYNYVQPSADDAKFVNISFTVDGIVPGTLTPADCTTYPLCSIVAPKTDGTASKGTPNPMDGAATEKNATVHVLKPGVFVQLKDIEKCLGETHAPGGDGAFVSTLVIWSDKTDGHTDIPDPIGEKPFDKDNISLKYFLDDAEVTAPFVVSGTEMTVAVKAYHGTTELTDAKFTTTCPFNYGCMVRYNGTYKIHVTTGTMTITKAGYDPSQDSDQTFLFRVVGKTGKAIGVDITVPIRGNGTVTITDLPIGDYEVTELDWSWRYTADQAVKTVTLSNGTASVTFNNSRTNEDWLDGNAIATNVFTLY